MIKIALKDISTRISSGITPLRSNQMFWDNGTIYWLKTEQLGEKNIYRTNEMVSKQALLDTSLKTNPANTLSVAMYGEGSTRGKVSILKAEMATNQACCNLEIDTKKADYEYVYYFLKSQYNNLRNLSSGVRKNLNSNDIKNFEIRIPQSVNEQRRISSVLNCLDSKIDLNNRINLELEGMAKLIYDYWFVQFDFPISEAQAAAMGRPELKGKPYKSSGGTMVFNEELKREVPEGWGVKELGEYGDFKNGINYDPNEQGDTWARIINVRNVSASSVFIANNDLDPIELKANDIKKYLTRETSILIARSGIPGATRMIADYVENTIYCGFIICFDVHDIIYKILLFHHLKNIEKAMSNKSAGTILKNVSQGTLKALKFPIPNEENNGIIESFNDFVNPLYRKMNLIQKENQTLTELRDWLLPMLMNGQVRVMGDEGEVRMAAEPGEEYSKS